MVKRFHPEFRILTVIDVSRFQEDSELKVQWLVHSEQLGPNLWRHVYATRVQDGLSDYASQDLKGEIGTSAKE